MKCEKIKNSDETEYIDSQDRKKDAWEKICKMCGACCGSIEGDPCEHLIQIDKEKYICKVYENRLGTHKTKSGKTMKCVEIRDIVSKSWPGSINCGYKNK